MKFVITGSAGHISYPLATELLKAGHQVTVIGRSLENLKKLTDQKAIAALGSVEDEAFLVKTFTGADALYIMNPPKYDAPDMKAYLENNGKIFTAAIRKSGVKFVVNLSSFGAHLPTGAGPVSGLFRVESALNTLTDVNILHLRPGYFYYNLFGSIHTIKTAGIIGGNFECKEHKLVVVDPTDIAAVAAEEIQRLSFKGHSVRYIASEEVTTDQIAKTIGAAVGKPDLAWIKFPDDQALAGMKQAGFSEDLAANYVEMGQAIGSGRMSEDYYKHLPPSFGKVKLSDFAKTFAAVYSKS